MAFTSLLQIGDNNTGLYTKEYQVLECSCRMIRVHNDYRPVSNPRCKSLALTVVAPGTADLNLVEWYTEDMALSGRIRFEMPDYDENARMLEKEIYFTDARCVSISEDYHIDTSRRRVLRLEIMAEILEFDSMSFDLN